MGWLNWVLSAVLLIKATEAGNSGVKVAEARVRTVVDHLYHCGIAPRIIQHATLDFTEQRTLLAPLRDGTLLNDAGCHLFKAMNETMNRTLQTARHSHEGPLIRDARLIGLFYQWIQFSNILATYGADEPEQKALNVVGLTLTNTMKKAVCWEACRECYPCWHELASMINKIYKSTIYITTPTPSMGGTAPSIPDVGKWSFEEVTQHLEAALEAFLEAA